MLEASCQLTICPLGPAARLRALIVTALGSSGSLYFSVFATRLIVDDCLLHHQSYEPHPTTYLPEASLIHASPDDFSSLIKHNMAPVRRYLRISKYSVLECRIYLDNPALAQSWLLNPRNPILPKVIESIRPLVLPKLREERERIKKKSKKKTVKDVIVTGNFVLLYTICLH